MSVNLFVSSHWLTRHLDDDNIQILDARMAPAGQQATHDIPALFRAGHIPRARFFDIEELSDHSSPLPHMMPRPASFAVAMRELGIASDKHLIVYDDGTLFSAPRAWWMLKTFGAENVSILSGGFAEWQRSGQAVEQGATVSTESEFDVHFDEQKIIKLTDILLISHEKSAQILDARSAARFNGQADEPRAGLRRGHMPGAYNVPWNILVADGALKSPDELRAIFAQQGVALDKPVVASCGSGVTAAVIVLALATLGIHHVPLYDGSWSEWGARQDLPVATANGE